MSQPVAQTLHTNGPGQSKSWGHRVCSPEATLKRLGPFLAGMGITRLADVTDLDFIGIPVAQAVRPMGMSLSVSQGKGMTLPAAMASAMMEAAEGWHAENITLPRLRATSSDIKNAIDLRAIPASGPISRDAELDWVCGRDLFSGNDAWVPFDLVTKDYVTPAADPAIVRTTNGLASGNTISEAIASALQEVIERDCAADHSLRNAAQTSARLRSADYVRALGPDTRWLADQITNAGLRLHLWDISNDIGIPCFRAEMLETRVKGPQPCRAPTHGSGCHLDPHVAAVRAITEAAQSRLTEIAGSREDLVDARYSPAADGNIPCAIEAAMDLSNQRIAPPIPINRAHQTSSEADVETLCASLSAAGIERAAIVDLSNENIPMRVVRAIVPGLGYPGRSGFSKGCRTRHLSR